MKTSNQFTHVPYIGYGNVIQVQDNDENQKNKFIVTFDVGFVSPSNGTWVPKASNGDEGNLDLGGSVSSYTNKNPNGRAGNMITHMELLGEGNDLKGADPAFLVLVAIPSGMAPGATSPLLDKKYSLSNQPPAESFDYSKFLPRCDAHGCFSLYGGATPGYSGSYNEPLGPTGRFPSVPMLPPWEGGTCGPLFYLPPGFYGNINTILNDLFGVPAQFNITLIDQPQYGIMAMMALFEDQDGVGSGCFTVDFSHSGTN